MRKLVLYCLIFLVSWQIIGFVTYFEFTHYHLKKEIKLLLKEGVPKDELVIFEFDKSQFKKLIWIKRNEFNLNGNLYDVVRKNELVDGRLYFECISDNKETILFKKLNQNIASNLGNENQSTPLSNWFKVLHFPILAEFHSVIVPYGWELILESLHFNYIDFKSLNTIEIESPPPQIS